MILRPKFPKGRTMPLPPGWRAKRRVLRPHFRLGRELTKAEIEACVPKLPELSTAEKFARKFYPELFSKPPEGDLL